MANGGVLTYVGVRRGATPTDVGTRKRGTRSKHGSMNEGNLVLAERKTQKRPVSRNEYKEQKRVEDNQTEAELE